MMWLRDSISLSIQLVKYELDKYRRYTMVSSSDYTAVNSQLTVPGNINYMSQKNCRGLVVNIAAQVKRSRVQAWVSACFF
jgi:hypothetical protein